MKVIYLTHFDLFRPSTNRISDIRFCEGFAENGCEVDMVSPYVYRHYNISRASINRVYGIEHPFKLTILPTPLWSGVSKWYYVPVLVSLASLAYLRALLTSRQGWSSTYVVSRDVNLLVLVLWINRVVLRGKGPVVIHWAHEIKPERAQYRWVYERVDGIIGTNSAITADIKDRLGIPREKLAITLNPISTRQLRERLDGKWDKKALRERLGLPHGRPLVVYTGKVGAGQREIEFILEAAARHPSYSFLLTGGKPEAVRFYERYCSERGLGNVTFTGFMNDYTDILAYQVAADALISFYTSQNHVIDYNFPQKISEYMLSGNPIVTPDYRATRDVLNSDNAIFVAPENANSLVEGIRRAIEDEAYAKRIADRAFKDVQELTFRKQTAILMDFFKSLGPQGVDIPARLLTEEG